MKFRRRGLERRLWREASRARRRKRLGKFVPPPQTAVDLSSYFFRFLLAGALLAAFGVLADSADTRAATWVFLMFWTLGVTVAEANRMVHRIYGGGDLHVLAHLPVAGPDIFEWEWRAYLRRSGWLYAEFVVIDLLLWSMHRENPAVAWWVALAVAWVQWGFVVGGAVLLLRLGRWPAWLPYGLPLVGVLFLMRNADWVQGMFRWLAECVLVFQLLPPGWPGYFFSQLNLGQWQGALVALVPLGAWLWLARHCRLRLRNDFQLLEVNVPAGPDEEPAMEHASESERRALRDVLRPGATEMADQLKEVRFGEEPKLGDGVGRVERWIWQWWTPAERRLMVWFGSPVRPWGSAFLLGWAWVAGVAVVEMACVFLSLPALPDFAWFAAFVIAGLYWVPFGGDLERAFLAHGTGLDRVPWFAFFPIGYRDLGQVLLKSGLLRAAAMVPSAALAGGLWGLFREGGPEMAWMGLRLGLLSLLCQPLVVWARLSRCVRGHTDWVNLGWSLMTFLLVAVWGIASLVLLVWSENAWLAGGSLVAVAFSSFSLYWVGGRLFNGNHCDLTAPAPQA